MLKPIFLVLGLFEFSFSAIPDDVTLHGYDIRNKSEKYSLQVGPENSVLEERAYKLKKIVGKKEIVIRQGNVVSVKADPKKDTEALFVNETVQIQIGRPLTYLKPQKQVIVFKVKNTPKAIGQTIVFENFE